MFKTLRVIAVTGSLFAMANFAAGASIQGTVRGPDGKPWQGADVKLEAKTAKGASQMIKTDASGRYAFNNLGNQPFTLAVMQGKQIKAFMENVKAGAPKKVDFDIKQAQAGTPAKKAKHLVWVPSDTGSNLGGRWVEADDGASAEPGAQHVERAKSISTTATNGQTRGEGGK